ncbi:MAG: DUF1517 domain-containing protein [Deltaproteobacteria bacterium]|nr:DUF1517 domain-containing protein [Deltaproteobacteria bacterium]
MRSTRRFFSILGLTAAILACGLTLLPSAAEARRSGASFGGRSFGSPSRSAPSYGSSPRLGGGGGIFFFPSFMPFGFGGGGGSILMLGVLAVGAFFMMRSIQRANRSHRGYDDGGRDAPVSGKAHVQTLQLGIGRSGRDVRRRLTAFAEQGDTGTETGLAKLLSQAALELLREKASIRHALFATSGPLSFANAETKMGGLALKERSKFQIERLRASDGKVNRSEEKLGPTDDILEYVVITVVVATREPLVDFKEITQHEEVDSVLAAMGGIAPSNLLGMEVIWTPADDDDALTQDDLLTEYPDLRNV